MRHQWIEPLGKVQSYGYDELNRLQAMVEKDTLDASPVCSDGGSGACAGWQADQWGNQAEPEVRTFDRSSFTPTSLTQFNVKNQITLQSAVHDAAGRLSSMGDYQFRWDAEDRLRAVAKTGVSTMTGYEYDGEGRRVKKLVCGYAASGWCATGVTVTSVTVYDGLGRMAAEYGGTPAVGGVQYLGVDHLGSTRVVTNGAGALAARRDFLPYGELIQAGKNGRTTAMGYEAGEGGPPLGRMFTGKERDGETMSSAMPSGLDYFGARYFSGAMGRFVSADAPLIDQHPEDPQSWNLYVYGRNNPLRYVDSDGRAATVTIETDEEQKRGTVKISATVAVYAAPGSKLSASQVAAAGEALKKNVESTWAGSYSKDGVNYTVSTDIAVSVVGNEKAGIESGAQNVIGLSNGPAGRGGDSFIADRGAFQDYDTGVFNINAITAAGSSTGAHEWGHLLGGGDLFRGSVGQLMNTDSAYRNGALTGADFRSVFGSAIDDHRSASRQTYFGLVPYGAPRPATTQLVLKGMWSSRLGF